MATKASWMSMAAPDLPSRWCTYIGQHLNKEAIQQRMTSYCRPRIAVMGLTTKMPPEVKAISSILQTANYFGRADSRSMLSSSTKNPLLYPFFRN
ncbi:hypothetical protein [Arachidicoccus soli]|uniref:Uncharacterized protein n=1 Tax=Arachidicoccus soli TaxID=2341117 RepID=A0A386HLH3_9BACT|nr:hypothetical protein [Arachidicoccus soli]AYD46747.1 hypothetical protein D6B99_03405 [Arachidicoccus soli]